MRVLFALGFATATRLRARALCVSAATLFLLAPTAAAADVAPGAVITRDNVATAADLLPPSVQLMLKHGMRITVVPYEACPLPRAFLDATEKYAGQVKLAEGGRRIENYVAGMPFPNVNTNDPLAAWQIMWNHEYKPAFSDDVYTSWLVENQDENGVIEKQLSSDVWRRLRWVGRLYRDPKPVITHDPAMRYSEQWGPLDSPFDLKGAGFLLYRYMEASRADDSWLYLPALRRVRRYSTAARSDTLFGSDIDQDSIWGFNSKPEWWDFRLLAEKEILVPMHAGKYATQDIWCGAKGTESWVPCVNWEKRKVWLIEGIPKLPQYAFGKRNLWIDKEIYNVSASEMFDHAGELWKVWHNVFWYTKSARSGLSYPEPRLFTPAVAVIDFQLMHSSRITPPTYLRPPEKDWLFEKGEESQNTPEYYTVAFLISSGT
jgi:hypothetical protein